MLCRSVVFWLFFVVIPCASFIVDTVYRNPTEPLLRAASPDESVTLEMSTVVQTLCSVGQSIQIAISPLFRDDTTVNVQEIISICDEIDQDTNIVRRKAREFKRYELLSKLMRKNYDEYIATASFLSPSRIPRLELPNLQDVPIAPGTTVSSSFPSNTVTTTATARSTKNFNGENDDPLLVEDCKLQNMEFQDNLLDKVLLLIFRKFVAQNTGGITSDTPGILGLVEQGRTYMVSHNADAQHTMVRTTLGQLMTPFLPPFYRIFMSGIIPKVFKEEDGSPVQLGPWFYAPWLTSIVTPTFFGFLVGPSTPNRRKDGRVGGLVVHKCKFLQESNCKGLCLHQCKLPAQQFFQNDLGLALTVSPNFVTQECQWSFGQVPIPHDQDPAFPKGCLVGCKSREQIKGTSSPQLCS